MLELRGPIESAPQQEKGQLVKGINNGALKVVYITGYGRSGSTLLDALLGANSGVFSCGELGNLLRAIQSPDEYCACGNPAGRCEFWLQVLALWRSSIAAFADREYRELQKQFESSTSPFVPGLGRFKRTDSFARYGEYTRGLYKAIAEISGASAIVDSSKSPLRGFALSAVPDIQVLLVHLVRDLRGVAWSLMKPLEKAPRAGVQDELRSRSSLRTAMGWTFTNYLCNRVRRTTGQTVLIRYEDYIADPRVALAEIAKFIGLPEIDIVGALQPDILPMNRHQVSGNRLRMRPIRGIAIDDSWHHQLSISTQRLLYVFAWPLMRRYGYRL